MQQQTDAAPDQVYAFYKKELELRGWKSGEQVETPQMKMLTAEKDSRQLMVQVLGDKGGVSINQVVTEK